MNKRDPLYIPVFKKEERTLNIQRAIQPREIVQQTTSVSTRLGKKTDNSYQMGVTFRPVDQVFEYVQREPARIFINTRN